MNLKGIKFKEESFTYSEDKNILRLMTSSPLVRFDLKYGIFYFTPSINKSYIFKKYILSRNKKLKQTGFRIRKFKKYFIIQLININNLQKNLISDSEYYNKDFFIHVTAQPFTKITTIEIVGYQKNTD